MNQLTHLKEKFETMGARLEVRDRVPARRSWESPDYTLDIGSARGREVFVLTLGVFPTRFDVTDVRPRDRHLVMMTRRADGRGTQGRFLCGHDERHWFVAGVPAHVGSVAGAKDALKPSLVRSVENRLRVRTQDRNRRRNAAFVRQGEWFFVPRPELRPEAWLVLRNEPIQRGAGRPHIVESLYRRGGRTVYVARGYPGVLSVAKHRSLLAREPDLRRLSWTPMLQDPEAFAKGRVRHPDHATVVLPGWHLIVPNTETSTTNRNLVFLD